MKQVFLRDRDVVVQEVPAPAPDVRGIIVETHVAAISVGTETDALRAARQRGGRPLAFCAALPEKVVHHAQQGTLWPAVRRRLRRSAPASPPRQQLGKATGYSCAGHVLDVGEGIWDVQPGDRVACAGSPHAEIVYAPRNLFVKIPDGVSDEEAAFVALGSIALHSVRQAELACGETVAVMGLGMVGQLVQQVARAAGARTIVADPVLERLHAARQTGAHLALDPDSAAMQGQVMAFTDGIGADAVILCMGGDSPRPMQQALDLVRDRGRLVVVGTPRMDIPRGPLYRKEVELRIARSYGPGRYDPEYEEEGRDYPVGYVRWTERRNMAEFLRLVAERRVQVAPLITHRFAFDQAPQAYETAAGAPQTVLGIVLTREHAAVTTAPAAAAPAPACDLGVAVVGAGAFARAFHLPNVTRVAGLKLRTVVTRHKGSARRAADEFGAEAATTSLDEVLRDPDVHVVIIATPHRLHAPQAIAALRAGKAVLCEKPMGLTPAEVSRVAGTASETGGFYAIGFNRRFAPAVVRMKELLEGRAGPLVLSYRAMGTFLPANHWTHDPARGGGRIVGEACHFFDLLCYLVGSDPVSVTAAGGTLSHPGTKLCDNLVATLTFADGSIASLVFGDLGHRQFPKERLEVFAGEGVLAMDDFRELTVRGFSGQRGMRLAHSDKGHRAELEALSHAIRQGRPSPADAEAGRRAMLCAFGVLQALRSREAQSLEL